MKIKKIIAMTLTCYMFFLSVAHAHFGDLLETLDGKIKSCTETKSCDNRPKSKKLDNDEGALKATFFYGSPVHEDITKRSMELSGYLTGFNGRDREKREINLIRGVFWNDDPTVLLWENKKSTNPDTWGLDWYFDFSRAKDMAKSGHDFTSQDDILGRSHFGDLQFLHAMANKNCEKSWMILERIIRWSEFAYKVGIGEIDPTTKISQVNISSIPVLFAQNKSLYNKTIYSLFRSDDVQEVALGSLLHIIQDSHFAGHVNRDIENIEIDNDSHFGRGKINNFYSYTNQNEKKHSKADEMPSDLIPSKVTRRNFNYEKDPINQGAWVLEAALKKLPWTEVEAYLRNNVFKSKDINMASGPGDNFVDGSYDSNRCKTENNQVSRVLISFEGGDIATNVSQIYNYLYDIGELDTINLVIDKENSTIPSKKLVELGIIPKGYPGGIMDKLLCKLNKKSNCKDIFPYDDGDTIKVPFMGLNKNNYKVLINLATGDKDRVNEEQKINFAGENGFLTNKEIQSYKVSYRENSININNENNIGRSKRFYKLSMKLYDFKMTAYIPKKELEHIKSKLWKVVNEKTTPFSVHFTDLDRVSDLRSLDATSATASDNDKTICKNKVGEILDVEYHYINSAEIEKVTKNYKPIVAIFDPYEVSSSHRDFCDENNTGNAFSKDIKNCNKTYRTTVECYKTEQHATHVAGIIGARKNGFGVVGLAPNVKLHSFKLNDEKGISKNSTNDFINEFSNNGGDIINMSFDIDPNANIPEKLPLLKSGHSKWFSRLITTNSILFVISVGNDGFPILSSYLQDCNRISVCGSLVEHAITVGGVDKYNKMALFSNKGRVVDILAPSNAIVSTVHNSGYAKTDGTSQAAAFVSGAAALLKSIDDDLQPSDIRKRLMYTADISHPELDKFSKSGILDVEKAVKNLRVNYYTTELGNEVVFNKIVDPGRLIYIFDSKDTLNRLDVVKVKNIKRVIYDEDSSSYTIYVITDSDQEKKRLASAKNKKFKPYMRGSIYKIYRGASFKNAESYPGNTIKYLNKDGDVDKIHLSNITEYIVRPN